MKGLRSDAEVVANLLAHVDLCGERRDQMVLLRRCIRGDDSESLRQLLSAPRVLNRFPGLLEMALEVRALKCVEALELALLQQCIQDDDTRGLQQLLPSLLLQRFPGLQEMAAKAGAQNCNELLQEMTPKRGFMRCPKDVWLRSKEEMEALLESGELRADAWYVRGSEEWTPLLNLVIERGELECVELLLQKGAPVDVCGWKKTFPQETPLLLFIQRIRRGFAWSYIGGFRVRTHEDELKGKGDVVKRLLALLVEKGREAGCLDWTVAGKIALEGNRTTATGRGLDIRSDCRISTEENQPLSPEEKRLTCRFDPPFNILLTGSEREAGGLETVEVSALALACLCSAPDERFLYLRSLERNKLDFLLSAVKLLLPLSANRSDTSTNSRVDLKGYGKNALTPLDTLIRSWPDDYDGFARETEEVKKEILEWLVQAKVSLQRVDAYHGPPLSLACGVGAHPLARFILDGSRKGRAMDETGTEEIQRDDEFDPDSGLQRVTVSRRQSEKRPPLHLLYPTPLIQAVLGTRSLIPMLLSRGADPNLRARLPGSDFLLTPLQATLFEAVLQHLETGRIDSSISDLRHAPSHAQSDEPGSCFSPAEVNAPGFSFPAGVTVCSFEGQPVGLSVHFSPLLMACWWGLYEVVSPGPVLSIRPDFTIPPEWVRIHVVIWGPREWLTVHSIYQHPVVLPTGVREPHDAKPNAFGLIALKFGPGVRCRPSMPRREGEISTPVLGEREFEGWLLPLQVALARLEWVCREAAAGSTRLDSRDKNAFVPNLLRALEIVFVLFNMGADPDSNNMTQRPEGWGWSLLADEIMEQAGVRGPRSGEDFSVFESGFGWSWLAPVISVLTEAGPGSYIDRRFTGKPAHAASMRLLKSLILRLPRDALNRRGVHGLTALEISVLGGQWDLVRFLCIRGAHLNPRREVLSRMNRDQLEKLKAVLSKAPPEDGIRCEAGILEAADEGEMQHQGDGGDASGWESAGAEIALEEWFRECPPGVLGLMRKIAVEFAEG
uniref:Uncharacterized protein n=1 Tax=Chromera velia CCMP2878 TaxID=1169474 RepID=A0A0G4H6V8_9ALVE|eukprot:Cvel_5794.t1-p1 / transcript=Cvel_5794.t1 / gene=Cvel_5794 / organism=Chromera_velia_CCMP2878 / gene_product=hypothetical protein / transcript_product=hypothetical protein / location=Cvel_scaffold275:72216-76035(+) / protein_length=1008 / sequence_SO=supercontig / SO=protein_coding / is_pseudo=false